VVSRIAVIDQSRALAEVIACPDRWRFQLTRHRGEQKRACSRRGVKTPPQCAQFLESATGVYGKPAPGTIFEGNAHVGCVTALVHLPFI
jgi:hypothetical protein